MQKVLYTGQKDGKILKWDLLKVKNLFRLIFFIVVDAVWDFGCEEIHDE